MLKAATEGQVHKSLMDTYFTSSNHPFIHHPTQTFTLTGMVMCRPTVTKRYCTLMSDRHEVTDPQPRGQGRASRWLPLLHVKVSSTDKHPLVTLNIHPLHNSNQNQTTVKHRHASLFVITFGGKGGRRAFAKCIQVP